MSRSYRNSRYNDRNPSYNDRNPSYNDRNPSYNDRNPSYNDRNSSYNDGNPPVDWDTLYKQMETDLAIRHSIFPAVIKVTYKEAEEVASLTPGQVSIIRKEKNSITISTIEDDNQLPEVIPNPVFQFEHAFSAYPSLMAKIKALGFKEPSPIQCQLWPYLMLGYDTIGIAQTGTGKTLAYLLPAIVHIRAQPYFKDPERNGPLCLIMAPTRELAQQIQKEAEKFAERDMRSVCIYGQGSFRDQCRLVRKGVEIIVATPGRLIDLKNKEIVNLDGVSYLILDEADRMLDMGFQPDITKVTCTMRKDRQTVLTSATWPAIVKYVAKGLMKNPVKVQVGDLDLAAVSTVSQEILIIEEDEKIEKLVELLRNIAPIDKVIVFTNKKAMCSHLSVELHEANAIECATMHGGIAQEDREQALKDLKDGYRRVLIATDVASRGLDVQDLTMVINFDFPKKSLEEYVHRSGRTGRAGKSGKVVSFVTWEDRSAAKELIEILQRSDQVVPKGLVRLAEKFEQQQRDRPPRTFRSNRY